jgi:hypothetical protein
LESIWKHFHYTHTKQVQSCTFPQVKTIKVLVEGGYHAQVRLHLPPGLREDEEMTFPLILHV